MNPKSYAAVALCLFAAGCRTVSIPSVDTTLKLPETYLSGSRDTTGSAATPYRLLLTDEILTALLDTALARNIDLKIAAQRIEISQAQWGIARNALLPQVSAGATAGVDRYGKYTLNGVGNYDTNLSPNVEGSSRIPDPTPEYFAGLRSTWEIDLWGKLKKRRQAAYHRLLASVEGRNLIVTGLIGEVSRHYYTLLALDGELEIIRENISLQEKAVELVEVQKAAGRVTELAVQQFRAQLMNTRSLEGQVLQAIQEAENQVNFLLGRFPQSIQRGGSIRNLPLPEALAAGLPSQLLRHRPDIRAAEQQMFAANLDVSAAQLDFYPSLTLSPYIGLSAFRLGVLGDPQSLTTGILGGLSAPVFNRRALKANLRINEAAAQEAYLQYRQSVIRGVSEVTTHLSGIERFRGVVGYKTEEVNILKQAASTSDNLFGTGYASYLEVITAQRSVLQAELDLITLKKTQFHAVVDLYRALGGGWQR
jgi:multidrug efflux system outer membrane protein